MRHKEELEDLKKYDPILYYEITGDPTGGGGDNWVEIVIAITVVLALIFVFK